MRAIVNISVNILQSAEPCEKIENGLREKLVSLQAVDSKTKILYRKTLKNCMPRCELVLGTGGERITRARGPNIAPLPFRDSWTSERDEDLKALHTWLESHCTAIGREFARDPAAPHCRVATLTQKQCTNAIGAYRELLPIGNPPRARGRHVFKKGNQI